MSTMRGRGRFVATMFVAGISSLFILAVVAIATARHYYMEACRARLYADPRQTYREDNRRILPAAVPTVVMIGDSRIRQWASPSWANGMRVIGRGIGGETTSQTRLRFDQDALRLAPDMIVIGAGINDLVAACAIGPCDAVVDTLVENLTAMAREGAGSGIRTYVLTIVAPRRPPIFRRLVWDDDIVDAVDRANNALRAASEHQHLRLIDIDGAIRSPSEYLQSRFATDTLHFSAEGYTAIDDVVKRAIRE